MGSGQVSPQDQFNLLCLGTYYNIIQKLARTAYGILLE